MKIIKSIGLAYRDGGSDKVYHAAIIDSGGSYTVQVEWGRRGSLLQSGTKADKVSLEAAEKAYAKVIKEKTSKGYQEVPGEDGKKTLVGIATTGERESLGVTAQLMNAIEDEEAQKLILNDDWIVQRKYDGVRVLAHIDADGKIKFTNRKGQVTGVNKEVEESLAPCPRSSILDGEIIPSGTGEDSVYWVYDCLKMDGKDVRGSGYLVRYDLVGEVKFGPNVRYAPYARSAKEKLELVAKLRDEHAEGAVFKKVDAHYVSGRPASGGNQLKLKFTKTCDVFLTGFDGKAYQMAVMDGKNVREVGRVYTGTTVGERNKLDDELAKGEWPVIEVRYLYATEADILFQQVYVRLRTDKIWNECDLSQLVRTNREIED